jgi:hypothetical protein
MKKILRLSFIAFSSAMIAYAAGNKPVMVAPDATIQGLWVDHGVVKDGRDGMVMHFAITVYEMKDKEAILCVDFRFNDDDPFPYIYHKGKLDKFHPDTGYLSIETLLKPRFDESIYDDLEVFMPYDEFDLKPGTYDLMAEVHIMSPDHKGIRFLDTYEFEFTSYDASRSANNKNGLTRINPVTNSGPRANIDSSWIEHNISVDGKSGMNLHYRFTTYDMKDSTAYIMVLFMYAGRTGLLQDKNKSYVSSKGNVAAFAKIVPGYPEAWFKDMVVFMPYDEFDLDKGVHDLIIDTRLIHTDGRLISSFGYQSVRYTK